MGVPGAAEIVEPQLVVYDEQDVHASRPMGAAAPQWEPAALRFGCQCGRLDVRPSRGSARQVGRVYAPAFDFKRPGPRI